MIATALARDAVSAAARGDVATATARLDKARALVRAEARRARQVVEIASAVVAGEVDRATGLAAEHRTQFPADGALVDELVQAGEADVRRE